MTTYRHTFPEPIPAGVGVRFLTDAGRNAIIGIEWDVPEEPGPPQPSAEQVTLNTVREHVERMLALTADSGVKRDPHSRAAGYDHACRDVLAILDMNGRPASEPVVFRDPHDAEP